MQTKSHFPLQAVLIHCLCWVLYIAYELSFLYWVSGKMGPALNYAAFYAVNIGFFYGLTALLAFSSSGGRYAAWKGIAMTVLLILVYLALKLVINRIAGEKEGLPKFLASAAYRAGHFVLLAVFYAASRRIAGLRRRATEARQEELTAKAEKAELETRLVRVRNAYLQQQVNPHLMFNALNFVYSQVLGASAEAARCVVLLSEMLRYGLEAAGEDGKVALDEELLQLEYLLEMNSFRFDGALFIDLECGGDAGPYRIIPLALFTLLENVFKHGDLTRRESPARISIHVDENGTLRFSGSNLKKAKARAARNSSLGLDNLRLRLQDAYPNGRHHFSINDAGELFQVELTLNL